MNLFFENMAVGTTDRLSGEDNSYKFSLTCMKESKRVSKYMSTFGSLNKASTDELEKYILEDGTKITSI